MDDYDESDLFESSDLLEEATGRLFLVINASTTLTESQAIALIIGLTALFGGLAAAAYFFLLSMQGGGGEEASGGGSGYGSEFTIMR